MPATSRVPGSQLGTAVVLLIGILAIAYGWFHPSKMGLYAGLLVTAGGVLTWVLRNVIHAADPR